VHYALTEPESGATRSPCGHGTSRRQGLRADRSKIWTLTHESRYLRRFCQRAPDTARLASRLFLCRGHGGADDQGRARTSSGSEASSRSELLLDGARISQDACWERKENGYDIAIDTLNPRRIGSAHRWWGWRPAPSKQLTARSQRKEAAGRSPVQISLIDSPPKPTGTRLTPTQWSKGRHVWGILILL